MKKKTFGIIFILLFTLAIILNRHDIVHAVASTCPANILCFPQPLYTSKIGTWYLLWNWNTVGTPSGTGWNAISRFKPVLGYYSATDQNIYEQHRQLLKNAGIDFIISDATNSIWSVGVGANTQSFVQFMDAQPVENQVSVSTAIGSCTWAVGPTLQTLDQRLACQKSEADWIWDNLAQHQSYFKAQSKPLLVNFPYPAPGNVDKPETWNTDPFLNWDDNRFFVGYSSGLVSKFPTLTRKTERGTWGWTPDSILNNPVEMHIAPGWDRSKWNDGVIPAIHRQNGDTLMNSFLQAIAVNPTYLTVGGFNDFAEEEWWEPATVDPTLPLVSNWKSYYSEPSAEAMKAKDTYGTEVADWYYQIVRGYSLLRWGLAEGSCYRDVDDLKVYCVINHAVAYQGAMPHGKPVIKLPAGTMKKYLTVTPTPTPSPKPGDFNNDGSVNIFDYNELVANFGHPYTVFDYNTLVANFGK